MTQILDDYITFLERAHESNAKLNIGDTEVGAEISYILGYECSLGSYSPGTRMTRGLQQMRNPTDRLELTSLLASANQVRFHIPNYNTLIAPFSHLLSKSVPFVWGPDLDVDFKVLKDAMCSPACLAPFDPNLPTRIFTDYNGALNKRRPAIGASLWQLQRDGIWRPVGYASRYLSMAESRLILKEAAFSSSVGECIGLSFALRYFYPELSQLTKFEVFVDAKNLLY